MFFDTRHKAMDYMNTPEKLRIYFRAMQDARIFGTAKFTVLFVCFVLLSLFVATFAWAKTGHVVASLLVVNIMAWIGLMGGNLLFGHYYAPVIAEVLKRKEAILGSDEQRKKKSQKKNDTADTVINLSSTYIICSFSIRLTYDRYLFSFSAGLVGSYSGANFGGIAHRLLPL
jgi:hypothetical protein